MKIKTNLAKLIEYADDSDINNGLNWYKKARSFCYELAIKYNIKYSIVCGILSALSPRNRWERNKIDAENFIKWKTGILKTRPLFGCYSAMVIKAAQVFESSGKLEDILLILNGQKIKSFFLNIYDTENGAVTVDSWILQASLGKKVSIKKRPNLTKKTYVKIERTIKEIALEHGLKPYELQAILWCVIRRLNN